MPSLYELSCQMAVVTILVRSCVFQLVNIILPLNKGRLNVLDLIYRMYL